MSLNPGGASNYNWNYSKPDKAGYSEELWGTVVSLQEVQAREFTMGSNQPGRPKFWPDGNPVMNIRMGLAMPDGSLKCIIFSKAGSKQVKREKPSLHVDLYNLASSDMMSLIGKTLHIVTWPVHPGYNPMLGSDQLPWNNDSLKGRPWGQGNPRLFGVEENTEVHYQLTSQLPAEFTVPELLCNDGATGGQPAPVAPQNIQPNVMPMQGGFYAAPVAQPQPQPQPMQQQVPPQPAMAPVAQQMAPAPQQAAPAPQPQQQVVAQPPMPAGMDPAVAAAMQAAGAVNVQPVDTSAGVYDDGIPF